MIHYQTEISNGCTSVFLERRDDIRTQFKRVTKHFFDHMAAMNFIHAQKKESLLNQLNNYVNDCAKVVKSTERRRIIHQKSMTEIRDLQNMLIRSDLDVVSASTRILIYKYQLQLILPQKQDPLFATAKNNLNEILKQCIYHSGRTRATKIK